MHAHRTRVTVGSARRVTVSLPSDFPEGEVEVIVLPAAEHVEGRGEGRPDRLSVDDLIASRLKPPPGVGPITLADMERAVADGAQGRGNI